LTPILKFGTRIPEKKIPVFNKPDFIQKFRKENPVKNKFNPRTIPGYQYQQLCAGFHSLNILITI